MNQSNTYFDINELLACVSFLIDVHSVYIFYLFPSGNSLDEIHFFL